MQREKNAVSQIMDKHAALPVADICGSSAWWLTAMGVSLQLVRRRRRVTAKRDLGNTGAVRSLSFLAITVSDLRQQKWRARQNQDTKLM